MRDLDTRVGPCRTVGDPPHEAVVFALHRAARELGPLFDLGGYAVPEHDDEEARDAA